MKESKLTLLCFKKKNLKEIVGISYDYESGEGILKQDTKSLNHDGKDWWIQLY